MSQDPATPATPLEVNIRRVFAVGTTAWIVALLVVRACGVWGSVDNQTVTDLSTVCLFGIGLGLAGLIWARFSRRPGAPRSEESGN